jgi:hypothetical protein
MNSLVTLLEGKRIRLSHYAREKFESCERLFQLDRLSGPRNSEESETFTFGQSFGAGVQEYLVSGSIEAAVFKAYLAYTPWLESDKKSFTGVLSALWGQRSVLDMIRSKWRVASFDNKPAIELGIRIDIDEIFYYSGFIDVILQDIYTGQYAVGEVKHTASRLLDLRPMYMNFGQALAYSIALDSIVGANLSDYSTYYIVNQCFDQYSPKILTYEFKKNLLDRLNWMLTIKMDCERISQMIQMNFFPKRAGSCLKYNRPCAHFGTCHMHSQDKIILDADDPHEKRYNFIFSLDNIIEDHLKRIHS